MTIYHNLSHDGFFGLNRVFTARDAAKYEPRSHPLVKVFETEPQDSGYSDQALLARAFERFNNGSGREDLRYFARKLRSLSVGDVVYIDDRPYSCESVGWKLRTEDELLVLTAGEADAVIRARFGFKDDDELTVTVPLG